MTRNDRIQIIYQLTFDAPFHFGTGISAGLIDRTVTRDHRGYLYVPASTFKGILRGYCEQLCRFYLPEQLQKTIVSAHDGLAALADFGGVLSPISRIFGSPLYPGTLHFKDAEQTEEDHRNYESWNAKKEGEGKYKSTQTSTLTQVRIDRLTRTAADQALFTSEFGQHGMAFTGEINGWLTCTPAHALAEEEVMDFTPTHSLLVLLAGLQLIEQLGGNKSTGKGRCTCQITQLTINQKRYTSEQWQGWLEHLDVLANYDA